jgi:integrase
MDIMGWSSSSMAKRYQHITAQIRKDIANRVGGLLWDAVEDGPGDDEDGPAGVSAPA